MPYDKSAYPQRWMTVQDGIAIGRVDNWSPQGTVTALPGTGIHQVDPAGPVDIGWRYSFDDESQLDVWEAP